MRYCHEFLRTGSLVRSNMLTVLCLVKCCKAKPNLLQTNCYLKEMSAEILRDATEAYKLPRAPGDKEHLRVTDQLARSKSPQKLYGVPVGKMFYEGAKRLLESPVSILPVRPSDDNRIAIEAYPALVVRRWIGNQSYKSDTK